MAEFLRIEDLIVYRRLCELHIEVCVLTRGWPAEEKYELGSQVRRSSNSSPANLAEKHALEAKLPPDQHRFPPRPPRTEPSNRTPNPEP